MDLHGSLFEAIFEYALDLPPGADRDAYFDDICRGDADLRDRVESFLGPYEPIGSPSGSIAEMPIMPDHRLDPAHGLAEVIGPPKLWQRFAEGSSAEEKEKPCRH